MFICGQKRFVINRGFTLIELIGVLAIMAVLASMVAPKIIQEMQYAQQDAEEENLSRIAEGLENYILDNRVIPASASGTSTWSAYVATQVDLPVNNVLNNVLTCTRRYWFDPSTSLTLEYDQNTIAMASLAGYTSGSKASPPTNPRAMIISDMTSGCGANISSVADNTANFTAVWNQADPDNDPLVEGPFLKIQRINLLKLFSIVTLQSISVTNFARKTYTNPSSSAAIVDFPLFTIEKHSQLFSFSISTGGFEPTTVTGGTATVDLGYTSGGNEFISTEYVTAGTTSPQIAGSYTSTSDINISLELTIDNADSVTNANSGYIDVAIEYQGQPQYQLEGQAGTPATINVPSPGTPEIVSFNVINGTEIKLYDQSWTTGAGDLLLTTIIKEDESFIYSPGPPTLWGR